jgi:hypothetical protein
MARSHFRRAVETGDLDRIMDQFADDAVLHSPITFQPFEGKAAIRQLLAIIMEVFQEFHYTDELDAADGTPRGPAVGPASAGGKAPSKASTPATGGGGERTLQGPEKKKMSRGFEF